jgi:hypothetical protein
MTVFPRTTLAIRQSRAQFLLTAIDDIMKGVEVAAAFNLEKPRGQAKKEERDIVIAMAIRELQNVGNSLDEAVKIVAGELALSEEAVLTSRKKRAAYCVPHRKKSRHAATLAPTVGTNRSSNCFMVNM